MKGEEVFLARRRVRAAAVAHILGAADGALARTKATEDAAAKLDRGEEASRLRGAD